MEAGWKLFGVGIAAAILCATVRSYQRTYALGLALAAASLLAAIALRDLQPVMRSIQALRVDSGVDPAVFSPLLRVCGIGLMTDVCCAFCRETGEQSICRLLEFGGSAAAVCALLPLFNSVFEMIRPYLGG